MAERRTLALPSILSPIQFPGQLPKPTPANLRRFAEIPVVRRAINVIKDRVAAMDWQVRFRRGFEPDGSMSVSSAVALRRVLEEPNEVDSFRTLIEQAIEDALTGGFGAIEMEATGDRLGRRCCGRWTAHRSGSMLDGTGKRNRHAMLRSCRDNWSRARLSCWTTS